MPSLPSSWGLRQRKTADGKAQIVGTNDAGHEYVARTCDGAEVTDRDLQILDVGNPEKRDKEAFIGFYREERERARKAWEHSQDEKYMEAADQVVHAGLHLSESSSSAIKGNWRRYHMNYEKWLESL
jgi:hypothetical protein